MGGDSKSCPSTEGVLGFHMCECACIWRRFVCHLLHAWGLVVQTRNDDHRCEVVRKSPGLSKERMDPTRDTHALNFPSSNGPGLDAVRVLLPFQPPLLSHESTRTARSMSGQRGGGGRGGRGGGGGGGRGGMTRGGTQIPMGTLTWSEFAEMDKQKPSKAYPVMEEQPVLSKPSRMESKSIHYQLRFLSDQRDSLWWPVEEDKRRKDLVRYSDKWNKRDDSKSSSLSLRDEQLVSTLQRDAFPTGLWNAYMTAETKRQEKERKREQEKTSVRKGSDWKRLLEHVEVSMKRPAGSPKCALIDSPTHQLTGVDTLSEGAESDEEEDGPQDEYEDDMDEDDYGNYFDNGEEDDQEDVGEGGAEETYE